MEDSKDNDVTETQNLPICFEVENLSNGVSVPDCGNELTIGESVEISAAISESVEISEAIGESVEISEAIGESVEISTTIGDSVEITADDSVICLDVEDENLSGLDVNSQNISSSIAPIDCITIPSSYPESPLSNHTNENDDDFCIVYEKIAPQPEVEIIEHYQDTVAQVVRQSEQSAFQHLMLVPELNLPNHLVKTEQRNSPVVTISDDDSESVHVNQRPVNQNNLITSLQQSQLESIEKKKRKIECPICLDGPDEINASDRNLVSTVCGHIFCSECLQVAIKTSKKCPQCRKKLTMKQFHPLFV